MSDTTEKPVEQPQTLLTALLAVQAEIPSLKLGKTGEGQIAGNKDYKYLTLNHLMAEVLPLLTKHGLVWLTFPGYDDNGPFLRYELCFVNRSLEDGVEVVKGVFPLMLDKQNSQGLGSALTYARRYALTAVLGLTPDDDDDGAAASKTEKKQAVKAVPDPPISAQRLTKLMDKLAASESPDEEKGLLLAALDVDELADLTEKQGEQAWRLLNAS